MDFNLIFVIGLALAAFAIPAAVTAYADRRWPKTAIVLLVLGCGSVYYAMRENPGAYTFETADDVILGVVASLVNR